jgi:hypothetical protein
MKELLKDWFEYWDWADTWGVVLVVAALASIVVITVFTFSTKHVDYYYLSRGSQTSSATCVHAHWTWHPDETAFCTDDYQKAIDFAAKANEIQKAAR